MTFSSLRSLIHAVPEVTYGTAPAFTAAQTFVAEDFKVDPMEGDAQERTPHQAMLSRQRKRIGPRFCKVSFKVALVRRAAADTPAPYRAALLAAGMAETVVAASGVFYSPISSAFGSMAILYNQDGQARTLRGIRGGVGLSFAKGGIPYLMFEGIGLYQDRTALAFTATDYTGWGEPDLVTQAATTFTINAVPLALDKFELGVNNIFGYRNRPNQEGVVAEKPRDFSASIAVLDEPRAVFSPETLMINHTPVVVDLQHGIGIGGRARFLASTASIEGVGEGSIDGEASLDLTIGFNAALGSNAEFALTLS
jgi:hypothetical protein